MKSQEPSQDLNTPIEENIQQSKYIKKSSVILVAITIVVLIFFTFYFAINNGNQSKIQNESNQQTDTASLIPQKNGVSYWELKKVQKDKEEIILTLSENANLWKILKWNSFLIYASNTQLTDSKVGLYAYNLNTGETITIYEETARNRNISDLKVINDILFFSTGGYLNEGATYWSTLPPTQNPQKIINGLNGHIEYMDGQYLIIQGEGDACWHDTYYNLLNIENKTAKNVGESKEGCKEGEEIFATNKKDVLLTSFHTMDTKGYQENGADGIYKYIAEIPITNPDLKHKIISENEMPDDIRALFYSKDKDEIFMLGKTPYIFRFADNEIQELPLTVPEDWLTAYISKWDNNIICLEKIYPNEMAEINLETNTFSDTSEKCKSTQKEINPSYKEIQKEIAQKVISGLNLPSNYSFIFVENNK